MSIRLTRSIRPAGLAIALLTVAFALAPASAGAAFGPLGEDLRLSFMGPDGSASFSAESPSVAYNPTANEYLVVWHGNDNIAPLLDDEVEIFGQRLSGSGAPLGARIRISQQGAALTPKSTAQDPSLAYNRAANEYLVAWRGEIGTSKKLEIFGQRLSAAGAEVGIDDFRISDMGPELNKNYQALAPSVAANPTANEYLVVWHGDDNTAPLVDNEFEIFAQRLTAAGGQTGINDFRVSEQGADGNPLSSALHPSVAYNRAANEYLIAWQGVIGAGNFQGQEFEIWTQRLSAAGAEAGGSDVQISDMGPALDEDYDALTPSVAANPTANEYLVVWSGNDNTAPFAGEFEIFGQRLTATGAQAGRNDFRVSEQGAEGNLGFSTQVPSVAHDPAANEYLVAWQGQIGVSSEVEIWTQRMSAAGAEVGGSDVQVSDMGPSSNEKFTALAPRIAANPTAGEYLVVWYGDDVVDNELEVFGRRLGGRPAQPTAGGGPAGPRPAGPGGGGGPGAGDVTAPSFVGSARAIPRTFAAGPARRTARAVPGARRKLKRGTTFRYALSEAARVAFAIERKHQGRRVGSRCSKRTRANRGGRRCMRYARIGAFAPAGKRRPQPEAILRPHRRQAPLAGPLPRHAGRDRRRRERVEAEAGCLPRGEAVTGTHELGAH